MHRYLVRDFTKEFTKNIEFSFNRFLGERLRPIYDKQWGAQTSTGYRIRDTAYFILNDGTPLVCGLDALPRSTMLPKPLDPSLMADHFDWLELYELHMKSWPRVQRALASLIQKGETVQDWRDMFPEHAIQPSLRHSALQVKGEDGNYFPLARSRADLQASASVPNHNGWTPQMIALYAGIADHVDTQIGYKFL